MRRTSAAISITALAATLAACGSGGSTDSKPSQTAATAWTSIHAAIPTSALTETVTAANDGNHLLGRPHQYTSAIKFSDNRIKPSDVEGSEKDDVDRGGGIEVFGNHDDAQARADYVQAIVKASPMFAEYDYVHGNAVIRVSHYLTPTQAADYDKAAAKLG
jgi:hypothetical protein